MDKIWWCEDHCLSSALCSDTCWQTIIINYLNLKNSNTIITIILILASTNQRDMYTKVWYMPSNYGHLWISTSLPEKVLKRLFDFPKPLQTIPNLVNKIVMMDIGSHHPSNSEHTWTALTHNCLHTHTLNIELH
jgi:hypothetical protein